MAAPPIKKTGKGKKAQPKQASEPAQGPIGNTGGVYVPVPQPNVSGGPTKIPIVAESAEEKGFLEKKQESLQKGIDDWVANQGDSKLAMAGGALATALNQVFFPTAWYELIPAGKALKLVKKGKEGIEAANKARKAEEAAKDVKKTEKVADKAQDAKKADANSGGRVPEKKKKSPEEACKHKNDSKKKKYVVYKADEFDKNGNKIGTYVGRTSGAPNESVKNILKRRGSGHHRSVGQLDELFTTDSYAAVRGAEHLYREELSTVKQINPIGPKNKRKDDYLDCAKSKGIK